MKHGQIVVLTLLSLLLSGCVTLGDYVWLDTNANGTQDASEAGVEGVIVNLYNSDNTLVASTTSNSLGNYQFQGNFGYSNYLIEFELPPGYQFTQNDVGSDDFSDSDADPTTGLTPAIVFSAPSVWELDITVDAGLVLEESAEIQQVPAEAAPDTASIGNFVWHDNNMNGIQDEDEIGFEGVQVTLLAVDGSQLASTSTDADGFYSFDELVQGEKYSLHFAAPETYVLSPQDQGDDDRDSDPDPDTGETALLMTSEDGDLSVDAGLFLASSAAANVCYGPGGEPFPEGVSPLTGLPVENVELLSLNPVFVSISIFPPSVRPPTGLASAPLVNQLYIGDGDTRLLTTFYGEFPQPVIDGEGGTGESEPPGSDLGEGVHIIGNRVWFDSNGNNLQDEGEPGLPNVPVKLVDINFNTVASTTTDGGGYYYFVLDDVDPNTEFQVRVGAPPTILDYYFVNKDVGNDDIIDSDVTALGRSDFFDPTDNESQVFLYVDAGVRQAYTIQGLRSGRTAYQDIQTNYCGCVVSAGADPTVAAQINTCANAFGGDPDDIGGAGLDVTRLQGVAEASTENSFCTPNLAEANLICTNAPEQGGEPAGELYVQYNINNISHFVYDEKVGAYLWYLSVPGSSDPNNFKLEDVAFQLMTDGLTGETLTFENVVVMNVNHVAQNAAITIIDLDMAFQIGTAFILRNGQVFEAIWSTTYPEYVSNKDQPLPVHFQLGEDPFPLAPGQVWINLLNEFDTMDMIGSGIWLADFDAPAFTP